MQRVTILCVGKLKEKFYIDAAAEYVKRLQEEYKASLLPETTFFGELGQKVELLSLIHI